MMRAILLVLLIAGAMGLVPAPKAELKAGASAVAITPFGPNPDWDGTVTASGVFCALKMIADPKSLIPPNSGCWRPVTVTAPPGCVVHAQHPSPVVYANHEMSHRVADMAMASGSKAITSQKFTSRGARYTP